MPLRNGPYGYGTVTKTLHWITFLALVAQFTVGYAMEGDGEVRGRECDPAGEERSGGDTTDAEEDRLDRVEERCEQQQDLREERAENPVDAAFSDLGSGSIFDGGLGLPELHVLLGLLVIALALLRVLWRATTPLPPWAEALSPGERRLEGLLEKALLTLLFVVPSTGLLLVAGEDDWLPVHVAAHICFFVVVALHIALVLRHTVVRRERHLQRML